MNKFFKPFKSVCLTAVILAAAFFASLLFQNVFDVTEHITTIFVFAVFLISLITDGYLYGIFAAIISVLMVNYAFTFPFFKFNFTITVNLLSAIVMVIIAVLTSALTTKIKFHEAQKVEAERERMRANLLRAVSHDLRTPLTTIYGSSTTLLENADTLTTEQKTKMIGGIKEESQWLIRMVENLLSITKISGDQVKIYKTPTVMEELVDSVILKFKKRYPEQQVYINIPDDIILVPMDAILIEQVIINLLENAVQHSVGMTELTLSVYTLGKRAIFEVRDNGCGIEKEKLSRIFTGYFDENKILADGKKHNAGIGLSVCASIVKAHGGDISAENLSGGGAVFRFDLSMEEAENDK